MLFRVIVESVTDCSVNAFYVVQLVVSVAIIPKMVVPDKFHVPIDAVAVLPRTPN